jgi:hypothetical protein
VSTKESISPDRRAHDPCSMFIADHSLKSVRPGSILSFLARVWARR